LTCSWPRSEDEMKGVKIVPNAVAPGTFQDHMAGMKLGAAQYQDGNDRAKP